MLKYQMILSILEKTGTDKSWRSVWFFWKYWIWDQYLPEKWNGILVIWDHWNFGTMELRNFKTLKCWNQETKKPSNQETTKPKTKKPKTKKPRSPRPFQRGTFSGSLFLRLINNFDWLINCPNWSLILFCSVLLHLSIN